MSLLNKNLLTNLSILRHVWWEWVWFSQFSGSVMSDSLWPHGLPVHNQLPEFTQIHVHWVHDAIQPSHPVSSPSPAFNLSQNQGLFKWVSFLCIRWLKCWSFTFSISLSNECSGIIAFMMDWLDLPTVWGTVKSPPKPQFKSSNSLMFSFLYSPTLTSIHDYWKNHSFD